MGKWNKKIKDKAIKLRKEGKTYSEIKNNIDKNIPKSTLSNWLSNLELSQRSKKRLEKKKRESNKKSRKAALKAKKEKRKKYLKSLSEDVEYLKNVMKNKDVAKIGLAMLYLGEGKKYNIQNNSGLALGNSDPEVVKMFIDLLEFSYDLDRKNFKARVLHRCDQNIKELVKFWSNMTKIPKENFYKTKPDPRTKGKETKDKSYKGVCVIYAFNTEIQLKLDMIARLFLKAL